MNKIGETVLNIGSIKIKSNISLTYDSRNQKQDIIYITITRWEYDQFFFVAEVTDYRKLENGRYEVINSNTKSFSTEIVNSLFRQISPMISNELNYSDFLNALLTQGLLLDTQAVVIGEEPVYGGNPQDWEIAPDDVIEPVVEEPIIEPTPDPIPE